MEGVLWKWTNYWNGWRTRWFVLEGSVLAYYNSKEEVNQGCKGSMEVSALEINVSGVDSTRMDLVIPGEQHIYLKAANAQERQQWLVALGSAKACVNLHGVKESGESSPDSLKAKKSELRLYCDLLVQQIHTIRTESSRTGGPDIQRLDEAAGLLGAACDTFIRTLEDCVKVANAQYQLDLPLQQPPPQQASTHSQQPVLKNKTNKSATQLVRSLSVDKRP